MVIEYIENVGRRRMVLVGYLFPPALLVGIIHSVALERYWYWLYPWMDVLTHYLGGFFVALSILWLIFLSGSQKFLQENTVRLLCVALLAGFIIGVLWEVFEFATGMFTFENWYPDTLFDIIFDCVGAMSAALLFNTSR